MNNRWTIVAWLLLAGGIAVAEELNCLTDAERATASLYQHWRQQAFAALDRRGEQYEQLQTAEQITAYQQRLKQFFVTQLGGFPQRTPLNPRTTKTIAADGYRIENVLFESRPHHHVTANLYLPNAAGPVPGVIVSSGHSRTGKTADYNQRFGIAMARLGIAALCFDPIGQGERSQILDDQGQPKFSGTTTEHSLIGIGSILVGRNTASYRVWDAMRAIDYLSSRPEIDPARLGMTGCSGGGTLTSYTMALDERVACAAPACYLTTFRHLLETIGPQDAEQNIFGQLAGGMDHPDYVLLRAPKPTLISSTTGDYFRIEGAWLNYRQAKRIYARLGFPEQVDLVEVEGPHGVQPQNLAMISHWMQRWLLNRAEPVPIAEFPTRPPAELLCLESGQVLTLPGERSVFALNAEYGTELAAHRADSGNDPAATATRIRAVLGVSVADEELTFEERGRVSRDGYQIARLVLRIDSSISLPALAFLPPTPKEDVYLYLHDDGKLGPSAPGGPVEQLVRRNHVVVSMDLRGQGETAGGSSRDKLLGDWKTFFLGYLLGESVVGRRVEDVLAAARFAAGYQRSADEPRPVHLMAEGQAGVVALHVAALASERFASVTLRGVPRDWSSSLGYALPPFHLESTVHGALAVYDLPDLERLAGPDKVRREEPWSGAAPK